MLLTRVRSQEDDDILPYLLANVNAWTTSSYQLQCRRLGYEPKPGEPFLELWQKRDYSIEGQFDWGVTTRWRRDYELGRALTKLLRHDAFNCGLPMEMDGSVYIEDLLSWCELNAGNERMFAYCKQPRPWFWKGKVTAMRIYDIVCNDAKRRFALVRFQGDMMPSKIKMVCGWSEDLDIDAECINEANVLLTPSNIPHYMIHGTQSSYVAGIMKHGLIPGGGRLRGRAKSSSSP